MSASSTPEPAARISASAGQSEQDEAAHERRRAQKRAQARRYRLEHPEEHAATRRRWVDANRDRVRASNKRWREEHLERARELNRESMRRAAARHRREDATRARARERVRAWREEHPDRVREYQRGWVEANRDKVREYYNHYYATHRDEVNARATARRDSEPERTRTRQRAWAADHKEHRAELQRARRADPDRYRAELDANAAGRRLKRALARAGLPPKSIHPSTAAERRLNERAAARFFNDPKLPQRLRQVRALTEGLTRHMLKHQAVMRDFAEAYVAGRERVGLPPADVESVMWARAVEVVLDGRGRADLLTSRDVAAAVRIARATVRRIEKQRSSRRFRNAVAAHIAHHSPRLWGEARIENRARLARGLEGLDLDQLVLHIACEEVAVSNQFRNARVADVGRWCFSARAAASERNTGQPRRVGGGLQP